MAKVLNSCGLLVPLLVVFLQSFFLPTSASHATAVATFSHRGVAGNITFTQGSIGAPTIINVSLTGLNNIAGSNSFPWHVHNYPFAYDGNPFPCGNPIVGGHYDPRGVGTGANYSILCNPQNPQNCEIGDISGKFGNFPSSDSINVVYTDEYLDLFGVDSIIGRSIVIHFENGSRFVCANINENSTSDSTLVRLVYSPYRNDFVGNIYFRQHMRNMSSASVYTDLVRIAGSEFSSGHNWHVHLQRLDMDGEDCGIAGPHYNPRNVDVSEAAGYNTRCSNASASTQRECEVGDLSNKGAPFNVNNRVTKQFYTDTDLPLFLNSEGHRIDNKSTVIHNESLAGPRIACANNSVYEPLEAVARFDESGVTGSIRFYQHSPYDPTQVFVYLKGLRSMAGGYHIHVNPVGPGTSPDRCSNMFAGGHWNPTGITEAGSTSDQFEIGDLSGKFGSLSGINNLYREYVDPNVPLFGPFSILGRSIVIHFDDADGTRWICSDIQQISRVVRVTTEISTTELSGTVTFSQPANDPYAETTIVVDISTNQDIPVNSNADGLVEYQWSLRQAPSSSVTNCNTFSVLQLTSFNSMVCATDQQLACRTGDLSEKHGNLLIPQAAGSLFRAVYSDSNLPLSGRPGLDSVFGQSRIGRLYLEPTAAGGMANAVCAQNNAAAIVEAPPTDATPTSGASPSVSGVFSALVLSVALICVSLSLLN